MAGFQASEDEASTESDATKHTAQNRTKTRSPTEAADAAHHCLMQEGTSSMFHLQDGRAVLAALQSREHQDERHAWSHHLDDSQETSEGTDSTDQAVASTATCEEDDCDLPYYGWARSHSHHQQDSAHHVGTGHAGCDAAEDDSHTELPLRTNPTDCTEPSLDEADIHLEELGTIHFR